MNPVTAIMIAAGVYFLLKKKTLSPDQKKMALTDWINSGSDSVEVKMQIGKIFWQFTDDEVNAAYEYVFDYIKKGRTLDYNSPLYDSISAIATRYKIFNHEMPTGDFLEN